MHDDSLDAVIELLQHTSELVSLFNDKLYISFTDDSRLHKLNQFFNWITCWGTATEQKRNLFFSTKLQFDLESMSLGFQAMVHCKLLKVLNAVIKPAIVNQDCVENLFVKCVHAMAKMTTQPFYTSSQHRILFGLDKPPSVQRVMHHATAAPLTQGCQFTALSEMIHPFLAFVFPRTQEQ